MIFGILFSEFFKIGLFAVGGGLVTIPFLFELTRKYNWFSAQELMDMIAVSQSTPGPIGINMATYAGFQTAGIYGGIVATFGLVLPSLATLLLYPNRSHNPSEAATVSTCPSITWYTPIGTTKLSSIACVRSSNLYLAMFFPAPHRAKRCLAKPS